MDTCVALVQAYLHLNGYFTVVEYPVIEASARGHARALTDLDILAVRFPGASLDVVEGRAHQRFAGTGPDPALHCPSDRVDMIVGEVKEGAARFNSAMRDPAVLAVALARFGCCSPDGATDVAHQLLAHGRAETHDGHHVRMIAFGNAPDTWNGASAHTIGMRHVVSYLQAYLRDQWDVLRHTQIRDPVFATLALIEKWSVGARQPRRRASERR